ncbi:DUF421 domain-containing protein [Marinicrinis sediminis]|uniref:DUF421 domain-containing protein n=1 Tax=Marinicrinis sediminis TaxID=1652465 RepID=A0ABW5RAL2_9BACL
MPDWIMIVVRSILAVMTLFVFTRLLGNRQISQLTYFEYITGITIGGLAAYISLDVESNWVLGILALAVWVVISLAVEYAALKSKWFRDVVEGKGVVLIRHGEILEKNLLKVRYSSDELLEQLRSKNAFRVADVEFAVLESSGNLSVLLKEERRPVTRQEMKLEDQTSYQCEPQTIVMDGTLMKEPLQRAGLSEMWLYRVLSRRNLALEDVYLAQVDEHNTLYVDAYKDRQRSDNQHQSQHAIIEEEGG